MASGVLMTVSRDEEERARIMRDEKIELDYQSEMTYYRRQAREEGREEGRGEEREYVLHLIEQGLSIEEIKQRLKQKPLIKGPH